MTDSSVIIKWMPRVAAANREQYAEARREKILDAALRVFSSTPFAETTMDEVAAQAGVSKGCLYLYFRTKEELLHDLIRRFSLLPELPELMESIRDTEPAIGIPKLVGEIWRRFRERKELARVLVREIHSNPQRARLFTEQVGLRAYRSIAGYLGLWMERGKLRSSDPMATAQCLIGMLWFFLLSQELMGGKELHPLSDEAVASTVSRMFLEGAAAAPRPHPHKPARH